MILSLLYLSLYRIYQLFICCNPEINEILVHFAAEFSSYRMLLDFVLKWECIYKFQFTDFPSYNGQHTC